MKIKINAEPGTEPWLKERELEKAVDDFAGQFRAISAFFRAHAGVEIKEVKSHGSGMYADMEVVLGPVDPELEKIGKAFREAGLKKGRYAKR